MRRHHALRSSLLVCLLLAGCRDSGNQASSSTWQGDITQSADTTFVHTQSGSILGDLGTIPGESLEVVYAGQGVLGWTILAVAGDTLLIGEENRIVVIDGTGVVDTLGRDGDGPGEFRQIIGLRGTGDTIEVLDWIANRFTRFHSGGAPTLQTVEAPQGDPSVPYTSRLSACRGSILTAWTHSFVGRDIPDTVVIAWWSPESGSSRWLMVEGRTLKSRKTTDGITSSVRFPFGPRALTASDGGCLVAVADGVSYKILLKDALTDSVQIIEVDEEAPPVPTEARTIPERWREEWPAAWLPSTLEMMRIQEYGDRQNKLADLQFDAAGRLWIRVVDSTYHYHPDVMRRISDARPADYRWDLFGTDGRRLATVHLPSNFTPKAWGGRWVYGIAEDEDGALVVGRLPVPEELQ